MKSPPPSVETDDCDDIFGPPRTYPGGYCPPKNRPSMISPKYRLKEERRKVLKISLNKLKKIEDAERSLCRSVLINNTVKRLQQEVKEEKCQKYFNYPRCFDNYMSLKNERNEENQLIPAETYTIDNDLDTVNKDVLTIVEENLNGLNSSESYRFSDTSTENTTCGDRLSSRKRSFDDMEDCDVQDVLSQFYMPPTPRMLTCIDDDEDVNVVDDEPSSPKKVKPDSEQSDSEKNSCDSSVANFNNVLQNNTQESRLRYSNSSENDNSLSCGQASMFSEYQSNVFHNLIASLET
ncbi:uncharacterized protein LOC130898236 [Diorhabda carinulata]|uniref:uncharacterized protein LOC130898236 n=1 Tax=Diorhabda carinulata TaxID=1163345 RepID=UPI0025A1443A|nr:uncharacterized protein LOC130898236 [Diorhabda carinulata]XP_057663333.1 uncharacterized protein LOC130898236 [Diorhabda carinulata]XP_057663334.1 uncharacterized protein LOC130898236 [Diorhabda carinulata]XP_057663336.1 uncharacterized protein LOC130898236 [Diorhabda carinulata]XP_057663337.1 uncharacterized protein LOC130898236 [Diorhabda carinulata]